jgi:type I restriction enzyme M protein
MLVAIFEKPELNFSNNNAGGDDILGDAYEFLMRHFATESGKAKGQFYTPSEVSRIMAKVLGIRKDEVGQSFYDPTCGSGSLLLKIADECNASTSLFGQEKDVSTAALAKMNMILHDNPTARIEKGQSTLSNPLFLDDRGDMKTFDYAVANPPFSLKNWMQGFNPSEDEFDRFTGFGVPPDKNGDYAFLLHIIHSLKSNGKGAVILPHGVLFRGNAESEIRQNLLKRGLIKGIIGLPANLFYGTGIPACIILIDKENASTRKGVFFIDASKGFMKDGNKNRLRDQDLHKIVDVFTKEIRLAKYSRMVPLEEIAEKEYNLNIPRYIDSTESEDIQNIEAHLKGGIPNADIEALQNYWDVYQGLKSHLFEPIDRLGFSRLKVAKEDTKQEIFSHSSFTAYSEKVNQVFENWKSKNKPACLAIDAAVKPKEFIHELSENLLLSFTNLNLINQYDVYQQLMDYWMETMQDDVYLLVAEGWKAGKQIEYNKKAFEGRLIPKSLLIQLYFQKEQDLLNQLEADKEGLAARQEELEEEHSGEDGYFADYDKINKATVAARLKEIKQTSKLSKIELMAAEASSGYGEIGVLENYLELSENQTTLNKKIREKQG